MDEILRQAVSVGREAPSWCIWMNASTLALLAVAISIDRLLSGRVSPAWRMAFYVPVLARVLIPLGAVWSVPWWAVPSAPVQEGVVLVEPTALIDGSPSGRTAVLDAPRGQWALAWLGVYASGVIVLGTASLRGRRKVRQTLTLARASDSDPTVAISVHSGPMVVGVIRPRIVIPAWLAGSTELPMVLLHERAHIARKDPLIAFGLEMACVIAWPIVGVWIAASRMRGLMEQACDERVIGKPGLRREEDVMRYASVLIRVAHRSGGQHRVLAFGAALRARIAALRPSRRWPLALQLGVAITAPMVLLACTAVRPVAGSTMTFPASETGRTAAPAQADPPAGELRAVMVQVIKGDLPYAGLSAEKTRPSMIVTDRDAFMTYFSWMDKASIVASRSLEARIGETAAYSGKVEDGTFSVRISMLSAAADGAVKATLRYEEGHEYLIENASLELYKGQVCVIRLLSTSIGKPARTLIISIVPPGWEEGC